MKKTIAMICICGSLLCSFVSCKQVPVDNPTSTDTSQQVESETIDANSVSDFEYQLREDGGIEITKYVGTDDHVVIPQTIDGKDVTVIGEGAFSESGIVSIKMPDTVIYISSFAFSNCKNLTDIRMSASLITITWGAFHDCNSLTSIDLSMESIKYIDREAFRNCQNLKTVKFGNNIQLIREEAFYECTALEEIILPKNLQELGDYAFLNCRSVKKIWIPKTLETWGASPFHGVKAVTEIVFEDGLKQIGQSGFGYGGQVETLKIPASVEYIASSAFMDYLNLKKVYFDGAAPQFGQNKFFDFITPVQDVKIYYNPSMPGWDTTPLREIYTLIPLSELQSDQNIRTAERGMFNHRQVCLK